MYVYEGVHVLSLGVFHIRRPYILVTEVSSPEGTGDYFPLVLVCVCVSVSVCVCVCVRAGMHGCV